MGLFDRAFGTMYAGTPSPLDDYWYQDAAGQLSAAGVPVTPDAAMKVSAFYRGVDLLSTSLAMLPLNIYEKLPNDEGAEVADTHNLQPVLHDTPNGYQDSFQWRRQLMRRLIIKGNAYCFTVPGPTGPFDQLRPITNATKPKLKDGRITYFVTHDDGQIKPYIQENIFHLCGPTDDGVEGKGIVEWARDSIGLAAATESFASRLFSQGPLYGAVLKLPTKPDDETRNAYKKSFKEATSGLANAHGLLITHGGAEFSRPAGLTEDQTQFIVSRKFSIDDIARWLGVPPHMIGSLERSTNNNIEEQGQEFITYSLGPWLTLWEMAIKRQLIVDPTRYFAEFVRDALVRGDIANRWQAYQVAVSTGTFTRNEVRRLENRKALPGLDEPLDPAFLAGKQPQTGQAKPPAPPADDATDDPADAQDARELRATAIATAAAARLLRKEVAAVSASAVRHAADADAFAVAVTEFYAKHAGLVSETLHLSVADAQRYCAGQASQVLGVDWVHALELWKTEAYAAGLAAIALEDAA